MELTELSTHRLRALLRFARTLTGDRGLAEDLVQQVVLRLLERNGEPIIDLDAYARRMIVNEFISWRRKWSRIKPVALIDERLDNRTLDPTTRTADLADLRHQLEALSRRQRAAIVLRYFADQTDDEIAQSLGCSRNAARSLISRGLAALRVNVQPIDRQMQ